MAKNNVREQLAKLESCLQDTVNIVSEYAEIKYKSISSVIDFMKRNTDNFTSNKLKSLIFVIGATGAGKSTLVNYLHSADNFIVSKEEDRLEVTGNCISEIGDGTGSTTLFPNAWFSSFGNFLDCPGEGDTGGIIAEAVESMFKLKVSSNIEQVKILLVIPQSSLGCESGYGSNFKHALDKNAQFLGDIQYFKNSMAFVISSASVRKNALATSVDSINNILKNHSDIKAYKNAVSHVISSKNIVTFSKPPDYLEPGNPYCPPSWNPNQREKIIELIEKLPFTPIPHKDFFNISTSSDVRETMSKALEIVKTKVGLMLKDLVEKASPFNVFAVELKPFGKYLAGLINGYRTDLPTYIKILAWNNYLKISPDKELVNKLNEEMIFLSQFVKGQNEDVNQVTGQDWGRTADLIEILTTTSDNTGSIIKSPGNNFSKWVTQGNVTTKPSSGYAIEVLKNFKLLHGKYEEQEEIEKLKTNMDGKYFCEKTLQVFSHNKDVSYTEKVPYTDVEYYAEDEKYCITEDYTVKKTMYRPVCKIREESYVENVPVTKYRTETHVTGHNDNWGTKVVKLGIGRKPHKKKKREVQVPYTVMEPTEKTRQVSYTESESYEQDVIESKPVWKTHKVSKSRPVIKVKEEVKIRKEAVYKDEITKEFNSLKHQEDIKRNDAEICKYRKLIVDSLDMYPKAGKLGKREIAAIISVDKFDKKYEDLQDLWQQAEHKAYFAENINNSLRESDIQIIEHLVNKKAV